MEINQLQCAELNLLLRQGAKMAREMTALRKFDARFGERLEKDFTEAADDIVDLMKQARKKTLVEEAAWALSVINSALKRPRS